VAAGEQSATYRDQKYAGVIAQTTDYSCGAAALASLLTFFFGIPVDEHEVLALVEEQIVGRGDVPSSESGLSALDLRDAAYTAGLLTAGYRMNTQQLKDYFARSGLPVIAHVTRPRQHYIVVVGVADEHVMIADPGWGAYVSTMKRFTEERGPSGVFIVAMPTGNQGAIARREQAILIEWMRQRVSCLHELREGILP